MKKYILPSVLALVVLDQWTKYLAVKYLQEPLVFIDYWLEFRFAENDGIAFSMPVNGVFVIVLALVVVAYLGYQMRTQKLFNLEVICYSLVMAGAIGNVIDRLTNDGKVIDFIVVGSWPVFNVADSCITLGIVGYLVWEILYQGKKA